jgi:5'(3')-deoxyribonucleotidase
MTWINRIALDSDGVLADFDKKAEEILGMPIASAGKGKLWAAVERYNTNVAPFFESLDVVPGAIDLVKFAQDNFEEVFVLTASGNTPRDGAAQKVRWYTKHFPGLKVIVVMKSPDKAAYASESTILVDDRMKSIEPWVAGGGIGVFHTSVADTIKQLKTLIG